MLLALGGLSFNCARKQRTKAKALRTGYASRTFSSAQMRNSSLPWRSSVKWRGKKRRQPEVLLIIIFLARKMYFGVLCCLLPMTSFTVSPAKNCHVLKQRFFKDSSGSSYFRGWRIPSNSSASDDFQGFWPFLAPASQQNGERP